MTQRNWENVSNKEFEVLDAEGQGQWSDLRKIVSKR
jgi:hypothetical protein